MNKVPACVGQILCRHRENSEIYISIQIGCLCAAFRTSEPSHACSNKFSLTGGSALAESFVDSELVWKLGLAFVRYVQGNVWTPQSSARTTLAGTPVHSVGERQSWQKRFCLVSRGACTERGSWCFSETPHAFFFIMSCLRKIRSTWLCM